MAAVTQNSLVGKLSKALFFRHIPPMQSNVEETLGRNPLPDLDGTNNWIALRRGLLAQGALSTLADFFNCRYDSCSPMLKSTINTFLLTLI